MAMVVVDASCLKQADLQPKSGGLVWGSTAAWRAAGLHSSNEPSELSQWHVVMMTALNIVIGIIIIIIYQCCSRDLFLGLETKTET